MSVKTLIGSQLWESTKIIESDWEGCRLVGLLFYVLILAVGALIMPVVACADDFGGFAQLNYTSTQQSITNGGTVSHSDTNDFFQQYFLNLKRTVFPNLQLVTNGMFQRDVSKSKSDNSEISATDTKIFPQGQLILNTGFINAAVGAQRLQEKTTASGTSSLTTNRDDYTATLGLRPTELPSVNVNAERTETFDTKRVFQNQMTDHLLANVQYATPGRDLNIGYSYEYNDSKDKLQNIENKNTTNSGRVDFNRNFFNNRVSLQSTANVSHEQITLKITSPSGQALIQQAPLTGLLAIGATADSVGVDIIPQVPANDAMRTSLFLVNGGDFVTNSGKVNIGFPKTNPTDNNPRDVGASFAVATEISTIYLYVNQDISSIANTYTWDVYISNDVSIGQGIPLQTQQWSLYQAAATFIFSPFDKRFEISFPKVTTQFVKVVTRPRNLPTPVSGIDINNILITQLQTYDAVSQSQPSQTGTRQSEFFNMNARALILESPALFYDLSYLYNDSKNTGFGAIPSSPATYILTNALSTSQRFSSVFSGYARVAREDGRDSRGTRVAYITNESLTAVPLRTVRQSLVVSTRNEEVAGKKEDNTAVFLTNIAEFYRGISTIISGGMSWITSTTNQKSESQQISGSLNLAPYRTMTLNYQFSWISASQKGGGFPDNHTTTERHDVSISYNPFPSLYLSGSYGIISGTGIVTNRLKNYGLNWSPFPDGQLQFGFSYSEAITSVNNEKDTTIIPSLRWNLSPTKFLQVSYEDFETESILANLPQHSRIKSFNALLNVGF